MITNNRGTAFWGKPTSLITPGDIFPAIPFANAKHPAHLVKKSGINPKSGHRENYNLYEYPAEQAKAAVDPTRPGQHDFLGQGRVTKALFLSWGSEVEDDLRAFQNSGKAGGKAWIAAPVYDVHDLSKEPSYKDPQTNTLMSMQEIVMLNRTHHCFFLKPLPSAPSTDLGWYVDFRRIAAVHICHFIAQQNNRIATLMGDTRNELYHQLLLFFTRARLFSGPVVCESCGKEVSVKMAIEDQNADAEPWL